MKNYITACQDELDRYAAYIGADKKSSTYASGGNPGKGDRAAYAAAIPADEWEEGRQIRRTKEINFLLSDLRRRAISRKTGKDDTKLGYLLREDYTGYHERWPSSGIVRGDGTIDASQIRIVMANSIKGRSYTRPQFIALMSFFFGHECYQKWKNRERVQEELATLWFLARGPRADEYKVKPVEKAPKGRAANHAELLEKAYQALLSFKAGTEAILTTQDLADALGIVRRTACTLLYELTHAGRIVYRSARWNSGIIVGFPQEGAIIGSNKEGDAEHKEEVKDDNAVSTITAEGVIIEENSKGVLQHKHAEIREENAAPITANDPLYIYINHNSNPVSLASPTITPPTLAELAENYLDLSAANVGERVVNPETGLVTYRRTAKHFAELVGDEYSTSEALAAYRTEQERRKQVEADMWQRFFKQLRGMTNDELVAYVQGGCRREVAELMRGDASFDRHLYKTRLKCAKQHLDWRGLQLPSPEHKPVTPRTRKKIEQQGVLNLVECERRDTVGYSAADTIRRLRQRNE